MENERIEIGKPLPYPPPMKDSVEYNYDLAGHRLLLFLDAPSETEIKDVAEGPAQFALYMEEDVILLLCKFGEIAWLDAPYSWHLVAPERREISPTEKSAENTRIVLNVLLADAVSGTVYALRSVSFSPQFSRTLAVEIRKQSAKPFDRGSFYRQIDRIYAKFPSSGQMLPHAAAKCTGGE